MIRSNISALDITCDVIDIMKEWVCLNGISYSRNSNGFLLTCVLKNWRRSFPDMAIRKVKQRKVAVTTYSEKDL